MGCESYAIEWKKHSNVISSSFESLLRSEEFVDVTIACNGRRVKAHKLVLSACSSFLKELLAENPCHHPIIILDNIQFVDLLLLLDFMYKGKMTVPTERIQQVVNAATRLKIKGLIDNEAENSESESNKNEVPETIEVEDDDEQTQNVEKIAPHHQTPFEENNDSSEKIRANQESGSSDINEGIEKFRPDIDKAEHVVKRRKGIPVKRTRVNDEMQPKKKVEFNETEKTKLRKINNSNNNNNNNSDEDDLTQIVLDKVKSGEISLQNAATILGIPMLKVTEFVKVKLKDNEKNLPDWQLARIDSGN